MKPLLEGLKLHRNIFLFLAIIILFSTVSVVAANSVFLFSDEIYHGVTVADIPVGDLSVDQADKKIAAVLRERQQQPVVVVKCGDRSWNIQAADIDFRSDTQALAKKAYLVGRSGNLVQRLHDRYIAIYKDYHLPLAAAYDEQRLYGLVSDMAAAVDCAPQNAMLRAVGDNLETMPEVAGQKADVDKAVADIKVQLAVRINVIVPMSITTVMPVVSEADFKDIDGLVASYTTQFNAGAQNRSQNIRLAAEHIDGVLVRSGDIFSFNDQVGLRLAAYGYKEAPAFIDGKLVPDWGGGVCQVSSTLYNAVLLADLEIKERNSHYSPPSYVPIGKDATVADNLLDFKFKNNHNSNIYITAKVSGGQLTINVYGRTGMIPEIKIVTEQKILEPNNVVTQDPCLELGREIVKEPGQRGFIVKAYRLKYIAGKEVEREWLSTDEFKPVDRVVIVGTMAASPK